MKEIISYRLAWKLGYLKLFEKAMVISLVITLAMFQAFKKFDVMVELPAEVIDIFKIEEIPLTKQLDELPPPKRPKVVLPSDDPEIPDDLTIEETELIFDDDPPKPPERPKSEEKIRFVPYDTEPSPIGGFAAIQRNLVYPDIARRAGVEGRVVINATIDINGTVIKVEVLESLGKNGCDEAAMTAIMKTKWKPALQRDKPVKVRVSIPVIFKLKESR